MPIINPIYGGDTLPKQGFVFTEFANDGRPTNGEFRGEWASVPDRFLRGFLATSTQIYWFDLMKNAEIKIPDSIKTIGGYAFNATQNMFSAILPNSLENIGTYSFSSLAWQGKTVHIPETVNNIGASAFHSTTAKAYIFDGQAPTINAQVFWATTATLFDFRNCTEVPTLANTNAFGSSSISNRKIVVPDSLYEDWTTSSNWSAASIVSLIVKASDYTD